MRAGIIKHKVWGAVGVLGALIAAAPQGFAAPEGGVVSAGSAVITHADKLTTIKQATDRAVIDWRRFDIAPDETTRFEQPSASSMTLNRVNDIKPTQIQGKLIANGGIVIVNPNGVVFGKNSVIDAASILTTTADIHNKNFMQGNMVFNKPGNPDAAIINEGLITAKEAGLVGFVAPSVLNSGIITAKVGKVKLASGDSFTIDLMGDGLLKIEASGKLKQQLVANYGSIQANGGTIQMTAAAARHAIDSLILNEGQLSAQTVTQDKQGNIYIRNNGGDVINSGIIDTSGRDKNERGGDITITGKNVALMDGTLIDASGHTGKSNTTNDKTITQKREGAAGGDIKIGGDYLGLGDTPTAENLYVSPNSYIFNDALETGDAGRTIFWSDNVTSFYGNVFARANVGDGGFVETSGYKFLDAQGHVDLTTNYGQRGTYFLDPTDIAIYGDTANGGPAPNYVSTDGSINLASSLQLWLDASDTARVNLTYSSNGIVGTVSGTSGTNTLTTTNNNTANLVAGAKIRVSGADATTALASDTSNTHTYTIASINAGTITTVEPLTTTYAGGTAFYRGLVNQLTDKSTVGTNHAIQATPANMPLWISNGQNGLGVTQFDGVSDRINISALSRSSTSGIFVTINNPSLNNEGIFDWFASDLFWDSGQFFFRTGAGQQNVVVLAGSRLISMNSNGINTFGFIDGNQVTTGAALTNQTATLSYGYTDSLSYQFSGSISESFYYSTTLGTNSRNLVDQYQSAKWGIALDPNSATALSEVVEATASTGYSVFTTRYLERLSTTANISLQATNNITLDLKGDNLNFTTANRSLTLNAGNQIINASAGTITTNNGAISLTGTTGGIVLNNALTLNSGTATTTFASPINGANNLTATAGTFSFAQPLGGTTPLAAVSLTSTNSVSLPAITAANILSRTTGAGSDITLGGNLSGSDAGTAITLASADDFSNAGNYTLTTGGAGGRWLIYSDKPADNNLGTLVGGFNRYTCTYSGACPALGSGNGLLYSFTPQLTATPSAIAAITTGAAVPTLTSYAYTLSNDYLGSDDASDVITGSLNGSTTYTQGSPVGDYNINYASGALTSALGYGFTYANNPTAIRVNAPVGDPGRPGGNPPPVIEEEPPVVVIPPQPPVVVTPPQPPTARPDFGIDVVNIVTAFSKSIALNMQLYNTPFIPLNRILANPLESDTPQWEYIFYDPDDYPPDGQPPFRPNTIYLLKDDTMAGM